MRAFLLAAAAFFVLAAPASAVSPNLVVSQVYGGGGNTGATHTHDFIEVFNRGPAGAPLNGMSLQYAAATGTGNLGANAGQLTELPDVTLAPGQYFLVQEAAGAGNGVALPAPDVIDATPIAMAAGAGKVALVTGQTTLGCNGGSTPCDAAQLARIVDLVGYGNANFFEGAAAPTLGNATSAARNVGRLHGHRQQRHRLHGGHARRRATRPPRRARAARVTPPRPSPTRRPTAAPPRSRSTRTSRSPSASRSTSRPTR